MVAEVEPVNQSVLSPSSFFYDLGNNYAGVSKVTLPVGLPAGATLTVVCTEYVHSTKTLVSLEVER